MLDNKLFGGAGLCPADDGSLSITPETPEGRPWGRTPRGPTMDAPPEARPWTHPRGPTWGTPPSPERAKRGWKKLQRNRSKLLKSHLHLVSVRKQIISKTL